MKNEAMGKLKDLGNSILGNTFLYRMYYYCYFINCSLHSWIILGNFGMSLDNFKMEQDPNSGSWSINMNNK